MRKLLAAALALALTITSGCEVTWGDYQEVDGISASLVITCSGSAKLEAFVMLFQSEFLASDSVMIRIAGDSGDSWPAYIDRGADDVPAMALIPAEAIDAVARAESFETVFQWSEPPHQESGLSFEWDTIRDMTGAYETLADALADCEESR